MATSQNVGCFLRLDIREIRFRYKKKIGASVGRFFECSYLTFEVAV